MMKLRQQRSQNMNELRIDQNNFLLSLQVSRAIGKLAIFRGISDSG